MCELCLSIVAVERYRWELRAMAVESFRKITPHKKFDSASHFLFVCFFVFFALVRTQPAVFCGKRKSVRLILFFSFILPSIKPALNLRLKTITCTRRTTRISATRNGIT